MLIQTFLPSFNPGENRMIEISKTSSSTSMAATVLAESTAEISAPKRSDSLLCKFFSFLAPKKEVIAGIKPKNLRVPRAIPRLSQPSSNLVDEWADMERIMSRFDEDGDGKISPAELRNCVRALGGSLTAEEAEAAVALADSDGDGLLGLEDFMRLAGGEEDGERRRNLEAAFRVYEMEGEGRITPRSLRATLGRLGEARTVEECEAMIRRFDVDGDGVLSFEEFGMMMEI